MKLSVPVAPRTLCPLMPQQPGHSPQHHEGRVLPWVSTQGDPGIWVQMCIGSLGEGEVGSRCPLGWAWGWAGTSRMTAQICLTHWMMVSGTPETVTARSVELGSKSPATCTCAPVLCRKQREMLVFPNHSLPGLSTSHLPCPPPEPPGTIAGPAGRCSLSCITSPSPCGSPHTLCAPGGEGDPTCRLPSASPPGSPGS